MTVHRVPPSRREIKLGAGLQVGQESGEERVIERSRDLVEGEPKQAGLLDADVEPVHRDSRQPETSGRHEALVAADDGPAISPCEDRLDEAELAETALEGVELLLADPPRVGGIWAQVVDRDELDREGLRYPRISVWMEEALMDHTGDGSKP